jgi:hypothetical protein
MRNVVRGLDVALFNDRRARRLRRPRELPNAHRGIETKDPFPFY